jgi:hypothetical protein
MLPPEGMKHEPVTRQAIAQAITAVVRGMSGSVHHGFHGIKGLWHCRFSPTGYHGGDAKFYTSHRIFPVGIMDSQPATQSTGLPSLDTVITGLRPGDNVVFQVEKVLDYVPFVHLFCQDVIKRGHELIYFRFASHAPLLPTDVTADIHELNPAAGFEAFIGSILSTIENSGTGACYVFDCLSDLAVDWYSDIMLGNFFQLTCPYLFAFDTYAYFALVRNRHASQVIDAIQNTAQVIIDIYHHGESVYIHPPSRCSSAIPRPCTCCTR